eukprot:1936794-Prymnesium_polylepis.1
MPANRVPTGLPVPVERWLLVRARAPTAPASKCASSIRAHASLGCDVPAARGLLALLALALVRLDHL